MHGKQHLPGTQTFYRPPICTAPLIGQHEADTYNTVERSMLCRSYGGSCSTCRTSLAKELSQIQGGVKAPCQKAAAGPPLSEEVPHPHQAPQSLADQSSALLCMVRQGFASCSYDVSCKQGNGPWGIYQTSFRSPVELQFRIRLHRPSTHLLDSPPSSANRIAFEFL
jgi:hypothetical protein